MILKGTAGSKTLHDKGAYPVIGAETSFPIWDTIPVNSEKAAYLEPLVNLVNSKRTYIHWGSRLESEYVTDVPAGASLVGSTKYMSAGLSGNTVVGAPSSATNILLINTANDTYSMIGSIAAGNFKYISVCKSPINGKMYFCPYYATAVMVLDLSDNSISYFDTSGPVAGAFSGNMPGVASFAGMYEGVDGKLYLLPYGVSATSVWVLDTSNNTFSWIDETGILPSPSGSFTDDNKCDGGLVDGNNIYSSPSDVTYMIKVDTKNKICYRIGSFAVGASKWSACAMAPNGKGYWFPYTRGAILVKNTDDTFYEIANIQAASSISYGTAKVMPTGHIYAALGNKTLSKLLVIDPINDSINYLNVTSTAPSGGDQIGGVLAPNGSFYSVPFQGTTIKKYSIPGLPVQSLSTDFVQSRYNNCL